MRSCASPWYYSSEIILFEIIGRFILSSEKPASQRRISDDSHSKLTSSFEQADFFVLYVKREWGIFDLKSGDRMDGVRAA